MKVKVIPFLVLSLLATQAAVAAPTTEKSIRELMALTGAGNLGAQMIQNCGPAFKRSIPGAPDAFWDDFMKGVQPDDLIALIIPIYQRNLTEEDIQAAVAFYRSPSGQRLVTKLPIITQQSMQAGQQWALQLIQRAAAKYQALPQKTQ
jgi:uncharacterized protein